VNIGTFVRAKGNSVTIMKKKAEEKQATLRVPSTAQPGKDGGEWRDRAPGISLKPGMIATEDAYRRIRRTDGRKANPILLLINEER